jgi:hypothetical protein
MRNVPPENSIPGAVYRFVGIPTFTINQTTMTTKKVYNLIVAGTRKISVHTRDFVYTEIGNKVYELTKLGFTVEIITGDSGDVDKIGNTYAQDNVLKLHKFKPLWSTYHDAAGPIRNRYMAESADGLIAFWDKKSRGTKNMIDTANSLDLEVTVFEIETGHE